MRGTGISRQLWRNSIFRGNIVGIIMELKIKLTIIAYQRELLREHYLSARSVPLPQAVAGIARILARRAPHEAAEVACGQRGAHETPAAASAASPGQQLAAIVAPSAAISGPSPRHIAGGIDISRLNNLPRSHLNSRRKTGISLMRGSERGSTGHFSVRGRG